ncbi:MAG: peptide methionine sulfoxide reductase [Bacteroidota bacterium]
MDTADRKFVVDIPEGYSVGVYQGRRYGITKAVFNGGRSFKLYAEELGGSDFVSLNLYHTAQGEHLKPCEMPEAKVLHFLSHVQLGAP